MYVNKCIKCGAEFETKNPKRVICPSCLYSDKKYTEGLSDEITPAPIDDDIRQRLNRMTLAAYRACRCSGIVRIDFIVTEEGEPYLIEINSIPGMSSGSIVPKQARAAGISLGELYDLVIADKMA